MFLIVIVQILFIDIQYFHEEVFFRIHQSTINQEVKSVLISINHPFTYQEIVAHVVMTATQDIFIPFCDVRVCTHCHNI